MRKSWRWLGLTASVALGACGDNAKPHGSIAVLAESCADEMALVFVDASAVYSGPAKNLGDYRASVGQHDVKIFIAGTVVLERSVKVTRGSTVMLEITRSLACSGEVKPPVLEDAGVGDASLPSDGGVDAGPTPEPVDPCSQDDDRPEDARAMSASTLKDAVCGPGDVDYFKFVVRADQHASVTLSTAELDTQIFGALTLYDSQLRVLDEQAQGLSGEAASTSFLLFSGETYFLKIEDLRPFEVDPAPDAGAPSTRPYQLALTLAPAAPVAEASAGTFRGTTNAADVAGLEGSFVAVALHGADGSSVPYKAMLRVRMPGAQTEELIYDPTELSDGVLRILFYDGVQPLGSRSTLRRASAFPEWHTHTVTARSGPVLLSSVTGNVSVAFPAASFVRSVDATKLLEAPVVSGASTRTAGGSTTVSIKSLRPRRARMVAAQAFGARGGANGYATPSAANFDIALDGELDNDEAFVVQVRAADRGQLALPLPETTNLSTFMYYSDGSAKSQ